jgi:hypothetical protein
MGLAACGDDGGDDDDVSLEGVEGADDGSGSGSGSGTGDTEPDDSGDGDDTGDIDLPAGFGNSEECLELATAYGSLSLVFLGGSFGGEDLDVDDVLDRVEAASEDAPGEVQDAFDTVIDTYAEVRENLGGDFTAADLLDPDTAEAFEPLSSDEFTEANDTVVAYFDEVCTPGN